MKKWLPLFIIMINAWTPLTALAKNDCVCKAIPESKTYQGAARKKKLVGFTIDWSCDYRCKVNMRDQDPASIQKVRAFYHEYFMGEDGNEGVCEGIVYKMTYNQYQGREVYSATDVVRSITPSRSKSPQLRQWSEANNCM